jgi:hypothetical protein
VRAVSHQSVLLNGAIIRPVSTVMALNFADGENLILAAS